MDLQREEAGTVTRYETWVHWPVNWTAVWVGALAALALGLIIGLAGISLGMHVLGNEGRVLDWHKFKIGSLIFCVVGAFLSFVVGGWVTGRIGGIRRSEPAMLHGLAHETAQRDDPLLEDFAFLEPEAAACHAGLHLLPDFVVGPVLDLVRRITLEIQPLHLR